VSTFNPKDHDLADNAVPLSRRGKRRHDGIGPAIPIRQLERELASPRQRAEAYGSRDRDGNVRVCHLGGHDRVVYRTRGLSQASEELERAGPIHAWACYGGNDPGPNTGYHWHVELVSNLASPPAFQQPSNDD